MSLTWTSLSYLSGCIAFLKRTHELSNFTGEIVLALQADAGHGWWNIGKDKEVTLEIYILSPAAAERTETHSLIPLPEIIRNSSAEVNGDEQSKWGGKKKIRHRPEPRASTWQPNSMTSSARNPGESWLLYCATTALLQALQAKGGPYCTHLINISMGRICCGDWEPELRLPWANFESTAKGFAPVPLGLCQQRLCYI